MALERPAVDAYAVGEVGAAGHVIAREHIVAHDAAGFAYAHLRGDVEHIAVFETRYARAQESGVVANLPAPLDLAGGKLRRIGAVHGLSGGVADLCDVGAPFGRVFHRPHDGAHARKIEVPLCLRLLHELRDVANGVDGFFRIDVVDAKHQRRIQQVTVRIAFFERCAGPGGEVAVAGGIDEHAAADGAAPGFGLDQQCVDKGGTFHCRAGGKRVEQQAGARGEQHVVGGALVGGHVIGLRLGLAEDGVRLIQAAEGGDACEQVIGDTVHDAPDVAVHIGEQAAKIGYAGGRAHAAEKTVALHQQRRGARAGRRRGGGDAGRSTAQHHDIGFGDDRGVAGGLGDAYVCNWHASAPSPSPPAPPPPGGRGGS